MNKIFKVAKIMSKEQLVINGGTENGVKEGTEFEIYAEGMPIFDPDTNESLGKLEYIKAKVIVIHVFPKMCLCENSEQKFTSMAAAMKELSQEFYSANSPVYEPAELNVNTMDISGGFDFFNRKITVGDKARIVPKPDQSLEKD